jgi:CO/xanthine dehydrogenase FAD-binding subunit
MPVADTAPALLAYDAAVCLAGRGYERMLPLSAFYQGYRQTEIQPGELLKEIILPIPHDRTVAQFIKMGKRQALSISVVSVAACVTLGNDHWVEKARIALGSVAPTPVRIPSAEAMLTNQRLNPDLIAEAAHEVACTINPISDIRASADYRKKMAEVLTRRALQAIRAEIIQGER